ncbi:magnesium-translocating P-type ATPase, partial [Allofournierella massiliensis]|uniref:magnesium-translocating P-type ATPase n=1 Tax=Allofournierella massiliensis TaxID=1650663 RepID=UPI0024B1B213
MKDEKTARRRIVEYACAGPQALRRDFQITNEGYDLWQVEDSRRRWGANVMAGRRADTVLYRLRRAFVTPFSMILLALAGISFVTDVLLASNFSRNLTTVFIVLGMLLVSGAVRFGQELRARRVADHLTGMIATRVRVLRDGRWQELPSTELVVGDRVRLAAGDRVPADLRLIEARDLFVSQSVITGESGVQEKQAGTLRQNEVKNVTDCANIALMGSTVTGGFGEGIVLAVGENTVYGGFSGVGAGRKDGFDRGANSIARVLIRFMAVLIPVVFAAGGLTKGNWLSAFLFALSVAVGLTPELLPMVVNACLARGCAVMGKKQTVVKNINAMQGFGSMDLLCVDKTGTLTGDVVALEYYMDVLGNESARVLELAYLNSLYHTGVQNHLDEAILRCRQMPGQKERFEGLARRHPQLDELPFDYEQRLAGVLVEGEENLLIVKGSLDEVCRRCSHVEYKGQRLPMGPDAAASVHAVADEMLEDGMKVLAVACKPMKGRTARPEDMQELTLLGYLAFFDAPKKTAAAAVARLRELHVGVRVLTGDQKSVAVSVCRRLGIDTDRVLTGPELEALSENDAPTRIERTAVFAELSPRQKARVVAVLRANGHTVGFLGDGMNDLPAILESDVGISVDTAAQAVKEGADVILLKKDLNVLGEGIWEGRRAFCNLSKYIRITAS